MTIHIIKYVFVYLYKQIKINVDLHSLKLLRGLISMAYSIKEILSGLTSSNIFPITVEPKIHVFKNKSILISST